jgi:hypothetical protein
MKCTLPGLTCAVLNPSSQVPSQEGVRDELIREQAQRGLTLAYFYRGVWYVNFAHRSTTQVEDSFVVRAGVQLEGSVTRDGDDLAFDLASSVPGFSLGTIRRNGSGFQRFTNVIAPSGICWSYDKSHLAMSGQVLATHEKPYHTKLIILDIAMREVTQVADGGMATSQCWSPDGRFVVYEGGGSVSLYNVASRTSQILAKGKYPTWSSDGQWIAFLDGDTYYAIKPSGEGKKALFKQKRAFSGLWWSPDSRIVAYLSQNTAFEGPLIMDVEPVRLRVRRLADGSEDWVAQHSAAYVPNYQWVTNRDLVNKYQPSKYR